MQRLVGRTAFTVGTRQYSWEDVILAAHLWSEAAQLERRTREGIACRRRLEDRGEEVDPDEVEKAADEWRYERDLLSADDMQAWLADRDLDMEEWLDYIERSVLRTLRSADLDEVVDAYKPLSKEVDAAIYSEAVCSGRLAELADRLAGQAAIYERLAEDADAPPSSKAELTAVVKRLPAAVKRVSVTEERGELIGDVMLSYERFVDRIAAPAALDREIEAHALQWTRLDCEMVAFAGEETAREAALLVREDGLPLAEAAALARLEVSKTRYVLEDVEPGLKDRLVSTPAGELVGPVSGEDGYLLISVVDRVAPSINDASILARARDRVIRRTIQREIGRRVRWHERL